jgi:hypothetical protein
MVTKLSAVNGFIKETVGMCDSYEQRVDQKQQTPALFIIIETVRTMTRQREIDMCSLKRPWTLAAELTS